MVLRNSHDFFAVSLAVLLCIAPALRVAAAEGPTAVRSKTVRFADLNTQSPAGIAALYRRIHLAAEDLCDWSGSEYRYYLDQIELIACVRKAEADAVRAANIPLLTSYFDRKRGRKEVFIATAGR